MAAAPAPPQNLHPLPEQRSDIQAQRSFVARQIRTNSGPGVLLVAVLALAAIALVGLGWYLDRRYVAPMQHVGAVGTVLKVAGERATIVYRDGRGRLVTSSVDVSEARAGMRVSLTLGPRGRGPVREFEAFEPEFYGSAIDKLQLAAAFLAAAALGLGSLIVRRARSARSLVGATAGEAVEIRIDVAARIKGRLRVWLVMRRAQDTGWHAMLPVAAVDGPLPAAEVDGLLFAHPGIPGVAIAELAGGTRVLSLGRTRFDDGSGRWLVSAIAPDGRPARLASILRGAKKRAWGLWGCVAVVVTAAVGCVFWVMSLMAIPAFHSESPEEARGALAVASALDNAVARDIAGRTIRIGDNGTGIRLPSAGDLFGVTAAAAPPDAITAGTASSSDSGALVGSEPGGPELLDVLPHGFATFEPVAQEPGRPSFVWQPFASTSSRQWKSSDGRGLELIVISTLDPLAGDRAVGGLIVFDRALRSRRATYTWTPVGLAGAIGTGSSVADRFTGARRVARTLAVQRGGFVVTASMSGQDGATLDPGLLVQAVEAQVALLARIVP